MIIKDIGMRVRVIVKLLEREKRSGNESKMRVTGRESERKKNDREGERVRKRKDRIHID